MKNYLAGIILLIGSLFSTLTAGEIWVSHQGNDSNSGARQAPVKTIAQGVKQAREWRRLAHPGVEGGIHIILCEGVYPQLETLFFRPEDSGTKESPTYIEAAPNEQVTISGGKQIKGWKKVTTPLDGLPETAKGKIWTAQAPRIGNRILEFRQLWINGKKAVRAMQFEPGKMERILAFDTHQQEIVIPLPKNKLLTDVGEMEMMVHQRWATATLRVKKMERTEQKARVTFHQPESNLEFNHPWPQPIINGERGNSSFYLCNSIQFLDQPGEWFQAYPSGTIYYYPHETEKMTEAITIAPALEQIVRVAGTLDRKVSHLYFNAISFEHATCMRPSKAGHVTLQTGMHLLDAYKLPVPGLPEKAELENQAWIARPEAAFTIRGAEQIHFNNCTFQHLASTALDYEWGVTEGSVTGCLFQDIGGSGILAGAFPDGGLETHVPYAPKDEREICSYLNITNNLITDVTNEDWGCVGIAAGYVHHVNIEHNEVSHLNYSGISVGWGWTKNNSCMRNNRIHANHVHHFAKQLYDAGGIYTLSAQPNSEITNNCIDSLTDAPYATNHRAFYIYFDEATSYYKVANNWCPDIRFDSNNPGPGNVWNLNGPDVDQGIKLTAGLEPAYKLILKNRSSNQAKR